MKPAPQYCSDQHGTCEPDNCSCESLARHLLDSEIRQLQPRYFKPDAGKTTVLFPDWPTFQNGRFSPFVPPDDELTMTEKQAMENEINTHTHP